MAGYTQPEITHNGTVSGEGTTSGADEEIFNAGTDSVVFVAVRNDGDDVFRVKVNGETNGHIVPAGGSWSTGAMRVTSIVVVESGAIYAYTGGKE